MVKRRICLIALLACFIMMLFSCAEKITLYATWSDGNGNSIMFNEQFNYTARFAGQSDDSIGTYTWYLNTIVLTDTNKNSTFMEWDIRGNTLYLTFTDSNGDNQVLALTKTGPAVNTGEEE